MLCKFRPPLLSKVKQSSDETDVIVSGPPTKKRRFSEAGEEEEPRKVPQLVFKKPGISSLPRKPLSIVPNPSAAAHPEAIISGVEGYYSVLW